MYPLYPVRKKFEKKKNMKSKFEKKNFILINLMDIKKKKWKQTYTQSNSRQLNKAGVPINVFLNF